MSTTADSECHQSSGAVAFMNDSSLSSKPPDDFITCHRDPTAATAKDGDYGSCDGALPETTWPESCPDLTENRVVSVVCDDGDSKLRWAFHHGVQSDLDPIMFWRSPHIHACAVADSPIRMLHEHLPHEVRDYIFGGPEGKASRMGALDAVKDHGEVAVRKVIVYVVSSDMGQAGLLGRIWDSVHCRIFLMKGDDFFDRDKRCNVATSVAQLANLKAASQISGFPSLVFNVGTDTTYLAAGSNGCVLAGGIGPGLDLIMQSLRKHSNALPQISVETIEASVDRLNLLLPFQSNGEEAIITGVLNDLLWRSKYIMEKWCSKVGALNSNTVFLTGVHGMVLQQLLDRSQAAHVGCIDLGFLLGGAGSGECSMHCSTHTAPAPKPRIRPYSNGCSVPKESHTSPEGPDFSHRFKAHLVHYGIKASIMKQAGRSRKGQTQQRSPGALGRDVNTASERRDVDELHIDTGVNNQSNPLKETLAEAFNLCTDTGVSVKGEQKTGAKHVLEEKFKVPTYNQPSSPNTADKISAIAKDDEGGNISGAAKAAEYAQTQALIGRVLEFPSATAASASLTPSIASSSHPAPATITGDPVPKGGDAAAELSRAADVALARDAVTPQGLTCGSGLTEDRTGGDVSILVEINASAGSTTAADGAAASDGGDADDGVHFSLDDNYSVEDLVCIKNMVASRKSSAAPTATEDGADNRDTTTSFNEDANTPTLPLAQLEKKRGLKRRGKRKMRAITIASEADSSDKEDPRGFVGSYVAKMFGYKVHIGKIVDFDCDQGYMRWSVLFEDGQPFWYAKDDVLLGLKLHKRVESETGDAVEESKPKRRRRSATNFYGRSPVKDKCNSNRVTPSRKGGKVQRKSLSRPKAPKNQAQVPRKATKSPLKKKRYPPRSRITASSNDPTSAAKQHSKQVSKTSAEIKELHNVGDAVHACWLPDGDSQSWHPATVKAFKVVGKSEHGEIRTYHVQYYDGDENKDLGEMFVLSKEEYQLSLLDLSAFKGLEHKCFEHPSDFYASIRGFFVSDLTGDTVFSRLGEAARARDDKLVERDGVGVKESDLNFPCEWDFALSTRDRRLVRRGQS